MLHLFQNIWQRFLKFLDGKNNFWIKSIFKKKILLFVTIQPSEKRLSKDTADFLLKNMHYGRHLFISELDTARLKSGICSLGWMVWSKWNKRKGWKWTLYVSIKKWSYVNLWMMIINKICECIQRSTPDIENRLKRIHIFM